MKMGGPQIFLCLIFGGGVCGGGPLPSQFYILQLVYFCFVFIFICYFAILCELYGYNVIE